MIVLSALLPWHFFSQAIVQSGQILVGSANLISKVYFPRLAIPLAVVGGSLVDFGISFVVMFAPDALLRRGARRAAFCCCRRWWR